MKWLQHQGKHVPGACGPFKYGQTVVRCKAFEVWIHHAAQTHPPIAHTHTQRHFSLTSFDKVRIVTVRMCQSVGEDVN